LLGWRLIFAVAILVPLLGLLAADYRFGSLVPGVLLIPLGFALSLMASAEVLHLLSKEQLRPVSWSVYVGVSLIFVSTCAPLAWPLMGAEYPADCPLGKLGWPLTATAMAMVIALVAQMMRYERPGGHVVRVSLAMFAICYVGLTMSFLVLLRMFHSNAWGIVALVSLAFVVKMSDTGAYTFGRLLGRHPMSPRLSPHKTIEGAVGGTLVAAVAGVVFFQFIVPWIVPNVPPTSWWRGALFGVIIALVGIVGDLCESLIKRDVQAKDSSGWLPGLGGVLDVMDSVLIAAPFAFICWSVGLVGPK
jgi:phosphatidate cytidylyltransferase